jgi:hypothetical protein
VTEGVRHTDAPGTAAAAAHREGNHDCNRTKGATESIFIIIRYQGMGPYPGQGAPVEVFEDGSLVATIANDAANDPVFNPGVPDTLSVGAPGLALDDLRIYDLAYPTAEEQACALITNGEWDGMACTVP